jgi:hypothetical protein
MTVVWASHREELCSDGVVALHVFDPLVGPDLGAVLDRYNPPGQQWTPALMLPHMRDGLSARLIEMFCTCCRPSLCRPVHRELMRNELLDVTTIVPATDCRQRHGVETYSRCNVIDTAGHKL